MMRKTVQKCGRHSLALEDLSPIAEGQITGDQQTPALVAIGEDLEQQFGSRAAEREVAQLITDQQVCFVQLVQEPIQLVLLLGFLETVNQSRGREKPHTMCVPAGGQSQGN